MLASALGAAAAAPLLSQTKRDWTGKDPISYPDPDIIILDPKRFKYRVNNSVIERVFVGCRWAEGPRVGWQRPVPGVERHSEQPATAARGGGRPRQRIPSERQLQ